MVWNGCWGVDRVPRSAPEVPMLLPAQGVEVVRGCGEVHHLPIGALRLLPSEAVTEVWDVVLRFQSPRL